MAGPETMTLPYNPLEYQNLAESLVRALLEREPSLLPPPDDFVGAGVYVIYYSGDFPPYAPIAHANASSCELPIYVGRAKSESITLYQRLREHEESISAAENLNLEDFRCRYLVVDDIWVPLAERLLLTRYRPLWNDLIKGFGNHDPGSGRYKQRRSRWDVLHPGRSWAAKCQPRNESTSEIEVLISERLDA